MGIITYIRICFIVLNFINPYFASANGACVGRMVNPVTDICWKCMFPLRIGGVQIAAGGPDQRLSTPPICVCSRPGISVPVPGIPVSFWEPARLMDITRTPYCLTNMGGISIGSMGIKGRGDVGQDDNDVSKSSFYQVHWYVYPILYWLELLMDVVCLEAMSFDLAYLTELDPFWADDEMGAILNPEGILFGNPIAQAACAADSIASTVHLPLDWLFWCAGSWGSLYPFGGTVRDHEGGVQASSLLAARFMAKLHRELLLWGYIGIEGLCGKYPMPIIKKSQYRLQMTYPLPQTESCHPIGMNPVMFQAGREFPFKGSDFGYLVFRKRDCCAL
ncbi:MAG: conjugal transfer pilus assembly protein TraU [Alphaproteobacteria bacterium]